MACNKRHLHQVTVEQGLSHHPIMQEIMANVGYNPTVQALLAGTFVPPNNTPNAIKARIDIMEQTSEETKLQKVRGFISALEFQEAFKKVKEIMLSSPSGLWGSLHTVEGGCKRQRSCSIPQCYDELALYVWVHKCMMDNQSLQSCWRNPQDPKKYISLESLNCYWKPTWIRLWNWSLQRGWCEMQNLPESVMSNGGHNNRSSIDVVLQKLLAFEYGRYMKLVPSIRIYYLEQSIHIAKTRCNLRFSAQRKIFFLKQW